MKRIRLITIFVFAVFTSGCSAYMAAKQPDEKDTGVLEPGTDRYKVIAELGTPLITEKEDGKTYDVFKFVQGYGTGNRTLRAVGHGIASIYTLGLWELAGTSIEGANDGKEVQVKVQYDLNNRVEKIEIFKGAESIENQHDNKEQL